MARTITVNPDAFENSGNFEPIPAGTRLKVTVYDVKEGVSGPNSKNPGSPQFEWTAKVSEEGKFKGREIRYNYVPLDPNVGHAWNLYAFAEAVGWPITEVEQGGRKVRNIEIPDNLNDLLGTEIVAKIGQTDPKRDDQGRIFNRVDRVFKVPAGGGGGVTEPPKADVSWGSLN